MRLSRNDYIERLPEQHDRYTQYRHHHEYHLHRTLPFEHKLFTRGRVRIGTEQHHVDEEYEDGRGAR